MQTCHSSAVLSASPAMEPVKIWETVSKQHPVGVHWHMAGTCAHAHGYWGSERVRAGRASAAGGSPKLSSMLSHSLLPAPCSHCSSGARSCLPTRALCICSFHSASNQDRAALLPSAAKGLLHSHASHPFLRETASQQLVLHPEGVLWMPTQPGMPAPLLRC